MYLSSHLSPRKTLIAKPAPEKKYRELLFYQSAREQQVSRMISKGKRLDLPRTPRPGKLRQDCIKAYTYQRIVGEHKDSCNEKRCEEIQNAEEIRQLTRDGITYSLKKFLDIWRSRREWSLYDILLMERSKDRRLKSWIRTERRALLDLFESQNLELLNMTTVPSYPIARHPNVSLIPVKVDHFQDWYRLKEIAERLRDPLPYSRSKLQSSSPRPPTQ